MSHQDEDDAPEGQQIAALLRERYSIDKTFPIDVAVREGKRALRVQIERPARGGRMRDRFIIDVTDVNDAGWSLLVDAADALVGMLIEAGWSHREVPVGPDLTFADGTFEVEVEYTRPDLDRQADDMLKNN